MGQVTPCCELAASTTRSYIDGRAATPNSELFHDRSSEKYNSPLKQGIEAKDMDEDMHPPNFLEIEVSPVSQSSQSNRNVTFETGKDEDESKPFEKHAPNAQTSALKTFVKALVRGHPSILVCETGEQKPCVMMLDKTIRTLAICEGKASKKDCMHEKHEISLVTSFCLGHSNSRRQILGRNCSQQTVQSWHPVASCARV